MQCDCYLCIYNKNNACILSRVCIDQQGNCSECIIPSIPDIYLDALKEKCRKNLDKADGII